MQQQQKDKASLKTAVKYQVMDVTQLQLEVRSDNAAFCTLCVPHAYWGSQIFNGSQPVLIHYATVMAVVSNAQLQIYDR